MNAFGALNVVSAIVLVVLVAVVYSAARDGHAPAAAVARAAWRRGRLLGVVLIAAAVVVQLLSGR